MGFYYEKTKLYSYDKATLLELAKLELELEIAQTRERAALAESTIAQHETQGRVIAENIMIDWEQAPKWAQCHTFEPDGMGFWWSEKPIDQEVGWLFRNQSTMFGRSPYMAPPSVNRWRLSYKERGK